MYTTRDDGTSDMPNLPFGYCSRFSSSDLQPCPHRPACITLAEGMSRTGHSDTLDVITRMLGHEPINTTQYYYLHDSTDYSRRDLLLRLQRQLQQLEKLPGDEERAPYDLGISAQGNGYPSDLPWAHITQCAPTRLELFNLRNQTHAPHKYTLPYKRTSPWLPTDDQWHHFLYEAQKEPVRERVMVLLAYEGGLRSHELLSLQTSDVNVFERRLSIRAETTKSNLARSVYYSQFTHSLLTSYLTQRSQLCEETGYLFLSDSKRNPQQPIPYITWARTVKRIAIRAEIPQFSTKTFRYHR